MPGVDWGCNVAPTVALGALARKVDRGIDVVEEGSVRGGAVDDAIALGLTGSTLQAAQTWIWVRTVSSGYTKVCSANPAMLPATQ